ncbi:MAG: hypothetical protein J6U40_05805 [Kiritimatiellae bacterium]|nr:hypothetical protein [Kiritimatiellia bacterium]MBP5226463.1 hypothetical protein [Kiritimatiellia bacterium]
MCARVAHSRNATLVRNLAYVRRTEGHGYSAHDWTWLMDFCDSLQTE